MPPSMPEPPIPRHPGIEVRVASAHPLVLVGATRQALRRAGVARAEIDAFSAEAFASGDVPSVCRRWVRLTVTPDASPAARIAAWRASRRSRPGPLSGNGAIPGSP
jgi:hypothetical protein